MLKRSHYYAQKFPRITHFLPKIKYNCLIAYMDMDDYIGNIN